MKSLEPGTNGWITLCKAIHKKLAEFVEKPYKLEFKPQNHSDWNNQMGNHTVTVPVTHVILNDCSSPVVRIYYADNIDCIYRDRNVAQKLSVHYADPDLFDKVGAFITDSLSSHSEEVKRMYEHAALILKKNSQLI